MAFSKTEDRAQGEKSSGHRLYLKKQLLKASVVSNTPVYSRFCTESNVGPQGCLQYEGGFIEVFCVQEAEEVEWVR